MTRAFGHAPRLPGRPWSSGATADGPTRHHRIDGLIYLPADHSLTVRLPTEMQE
jgi:hypothetical protein